MHSPTWTLESRPFSKGVVERDIGAVCDIGVYGYVDEELNAAG